MRQTTSKLRTAQFLAIGVDIAIETGFIGLTCYTVAARAGVHHSLVRRYLGRSDTLHKRVAMAVYAVKLRKPKDKATRLNIDRVLCEATALGILSAA